MTSERITLMEIIVGKGLNEAFAMTLENYLKNEHEVNKMVTYLKNNNGVNSEDIIVEAKRIRFGLSVL